MERPTDTHKRSKSSFSFRSNKSDKSDPASKITDLHGTETERQKSKFHTETIRDPNKAIRDAQPVDRMREANTLPALRSAQYKDWKGDPIVDADASNPTRPRLERPLDTIRSFEAAIDNEWKRKSSTMRPDGADLTQYSSRRNSYAAGSEAPYGARGATPMSAYGGRNPNRHHDHHSQRPHNHRLQTAPTTTNGYNVSPTHGYSQSYDTVDTGNSYSTSASEPWTNSTDPSSENSSIERMYGANGYTNGYKGEYSDTYGGGQHHRESPRHDAIQEEYGYDDGYGYTQGEYNNGYNSGHTPAAVPRHSGQWPSRQAGPPPPAHSAGPPTLPPPPSTHQPQRNVIPLGGGPSPGAPPPPPKQNTLRPRPQMQQSPTSPDGKRKSWLKRRFSRNG